MGKSSKGPPANTSQTTTSQYPDELKPFIADIFGKAKGIEEQRSSDGYQAYNAPRIAGFNDDQTTAFQGIRDAQGASQPYFGAQSALINRATAGPSAAQTAQYMNPYTQNVIDIQQRELGRQGAQERQRIGAGAVGAGGFGGSRQAILEAEQMRNQGMRGDDIQAKGLNQAYAQAQQGIAQAGARDLQGAGMYGQMGTQVPAQRMKELGALAGVGAADQTQRQRALDLGFQQFRDEYNAPMQNLNEYSAILRGFPLPADTSMSQTSYSPVAPLSSQLLGAGAGLTGMAGMAGLFGASGGQVKKLREGGLASMYAPSSNRVRMGKTNYAGDELIEEEVVEEYKPKNWFDAGMNMFRPPEAKGKSIYEAMQILGGGDSTISEGEEREKVQAFNELTPEQQLIQRKEEENQKLLNANFQLIKEEAAGIRDVDGNLIENVAVEESITENVPATPFEVPKNQAEAFMNWMSGEQRDPDREQRMRFATWGPVLAGASRIMSAKDTATAVGELFNTGAKVAQSYIGQKGSETAMKAATRASTLAGAKTMSEIVENLTPTAAYVAANSSIDKLITSNDGQVPDKTTPELLETYERLVDQRDVIAGQLGSEKLQQLREDTLNGLRPTPGREIVLTPEIMGSLSLEELYKQFTNSDAYKEVPIGEAPATIKKAEGGKIRSFDFVEQGDTLVAVPKLT